MLKRLAMPVRRMLDFALPPRCPGCGVIIPDLHRFCVDCWRRLDFLGEPCCAVCGDPFDRAIGPDARCGACLKDPPAFDRARAAVAYGEVARKVALKLKYGGRPGLAETIARQLDRLVAADADGVLVPVPLHRWRMWRRGYNQSALIARALARRTGLGLAVDGVRRKRATPVLRGLGPADRRKAVAGAFAVPPHQRGAIRGRRVLLIDDVYTTGATANSVAKALKRAGAAEVHLICWARVVRQDGRRR